MDEQTNAPEKPEALIARLRRDLELEREGRTKAEAYVKEVTRASARMIEEMVKLQRQAMDSELEALRKEVAKLTADLEAERRRPKPEPNGDRAPGLFRRRV